MSVTTPIKLSVNTRNRKTLAFMLYLRDLSYEQKVHSVSTQIVKLCQCEFLGIRSVTDYEP